jgi:PqqD family protein of HPr-rel-A system
MLSETPQMNAKCLRPMGEMRSRDLGDEVLFYDHEGDQLHVLNRPARAIFLLCDGTRTEDQVAEDFAEQYDVENEAAQNDAREVITQLLELGILANS